MQSPYNWTPRGKQLRPTFLPTAASTQLDTALALATLLNNPIRILQFTATRSRDKRVWIIPVRRLELASHFGFAKEPIVKQVYKITYPTGKIYIGKDSVGSARYMGSPSMELVNADFENIPEEQRRSYSLHKEILWESNSASEAELAAKEIEYIRMFRANDPVVGYNRWPKLLTDGSTPNDTDVPGTT